MRKLFQQATVFPCSIMQRHNLEHIIGAGAILNLAHVKFNLTCVACAKTVFWVVAMHYIQVLENGAALFNKENLTCFFIEN
ncbi:hypothetical protein BpHYR1_053918 [Brachionus plicatilis]|uniref:Uncharacterized protein n=1 Tax=Brachionus plicatilis TaxID=10195 RepID=A0A3M7QCC2_BRAPC|nr:hypothetical protein BpHYR1_053918 [Brachionus plicatilis]